jgi:hypothetical protein
MRQFDWPEAGKFFPKIQSANTSLAAWRFNLRFAPAPKIGNRQSQIIN